MHLEPPLSGPRVEDCEGLRDNLVLCHKVTKVHSAWRGLKVGGGWEAGGGGGGGGVVVEGGGGGGGGRRRGGRGEKLEGEVSERELVYK